jgi:histidyl-tRNA synthetase
MQRVYRGERPQRGREREFYQCDIDVIGKDRLDPAYDAELPAIIAQIFTELGVKGFTIHFSNRKVLRGLLQGRGVTDAEKQKLALREIDKLDKTGAAKVREALTELGLAGDVSGHLLQVIALKGGKDEMLAALRAMPCDDALFRQGLAELEQMVASLRALGVPEERTRLNLAIARGLDYYTGTVYETLFDDHPAFGSVCSGGRYDDLAGHYTKSKLPGVGISIGLTRLFTLLEDAKLLPTAPPAVQILVTQLEPERRAEYLALAAELRREGFRVENYLEPARLDRQLKHADKSGVPFVILFGTAEKEKGVVLVKDMAQKAQHEIPVRALVEKLRGLLRE